MGKISLNQYGDCACKELKLSWAEHEQSKVHNCIDEIAERITDAGALSSTDTV